MEYGVYTDFDAILFQHLDIYVFDDAAPEEAAYIGYVNVPLMSLRDNKERTEKTFELRGPDDKQNVGTIDVELYWQHEYFKPKCQPRTPLEVCLDSQLSHTIDQPCMFIFSIIQ